LQAVSVLSGYRKGNETAEMAERPRNDDGGISNFHENAQSAILRGAQDDRVGGLSEGAKTGRAGSQPHRSMLENSDPWRMAGDE